MIKTSYNPIDEKMEKYILHKSINKYFPYIKLTKKQKIFFNEYIKKNNKYTITHDMIENIKGTYIKQEIIFNHQNILKKLDEIIKLYKLDYDIYILSMIYDYPPLILYKLINIKDEENNNIAKLIDDYSIVDEKKQLENANNFELEINKLLTKHNILFQTQEELQKEQIKQYGYPISTPDFLIKSELKYNDKIIKWIDAKNFYGTNTKFLKKKIKKQIEKYIKNYGYGCIIFKHGYTKELQDYFNQNVLMLHINYINL
jgi:hypothetical protein